MFTLQKEKISSDAQAFIGSQKEEQVYTAFELGVTIMNKVQLNSDMDYVKNHVDKLITSTHTTFEGLQNNYAEIIKKNVEDKFDPAISNSYSKRFGDYLNQQATVLKDTITLHLTNVKDTMAKVQEQTSDSDQSSLGKTKAMVAQTQDFIQAQFNEGDTKSYAYQMKQKLTETFGNIDQNLKTSIADQIRSEFSISMKPIMDEFVTIRELISKEEGKAEIMEITSAKGFEFEDDLFAKLQSIASPYSDSVEETADAKEITGSKKGDFIYNFTELNSKIIIEAKNKEVRQKESLTYMKAALASRGCDFGILVAKSHDQLQKQIGRWNFYDNVIICAADDVEISLRYARFIIQLRKVKTEGVNVGEIKSKISKLNEEIKKFQSVRTNLTNIKSAVDVGVDKIRSEIDGIQESIKNIFSELETIIKN